MSKITIAKWRDAIKSENDEESIVGFYKENLEVKKMLGLQEMVAFVNGTANSCFDTSGEYMPEAKYFIIKSNIIEFYTNITLPENMNDRYKMIYSSWNILSNIIFDIIDSEQYDEMCAAIDKRINMILNKSRDEIRNKIRDIVNIGHTYLNNFVDLFKDVSNDDIKSIMSAISDGNKLDEEKIVEAIVKRKENGKDI